jgi:glutamine amidotransferase
MAAFVEETGRKHGIKETLWMTLGVSDGRKVWAVRYASDGDAPTLYHSHDAEDLFRINPELRGRLGESTRLVVSEPVGKYAEMWVTVPQASLVEVEKGRVEIKPFRPAR